MDGMYHEHFLICMLILFCWLEPTESKSPICDAAHNLFQCNTTSQCVTLTQRCDFRYDCDDRSDELGCVRPSCNTTTQYTCANGKCIHSNWICDGENDCVDRSDETDELCSGDCKEGYFRCRGSKACMPNSYKCDGDADCTGGEDEENCPARECRDDEFQCSNKQQCIDIDYRCDGVNECRDRSDEVGCTDIICKDNQFTCADKTHCIDEDWKCDGISDCRDESDEQECENENRKCLPQYFTCKSGTIPCIPLSWKCDGNKECSDGSDELNCDNIKDRCPFGESHCANRRQCISKRKFCDGIWDCVDKSDESDCAGKKPAKSPQSCPLETHYRCPGDAGKCIPAKRLCDSIKDCPGGEDEKQGPHFCNYNECTDATYSNCSHICIDMRVGFKCECRKGYKLAKDKHTCEDIDECIRGISNPCQEFCFNTNGSHKCSCYEGFTLLPNGECKPNDEKHDVSFIVSGIEDIRKITLDWHRGHKVVVPNIPAVAVRFLALDIRNGFVYWSDPKNEAISRYKISTLDSLKASPPKPEILVRSPTIKSPGRIALDWVHELLFWVDSDRESISVSKLDGTMSKTLYRFPNTIVAGFAVHPKYGYIYMGCILNSGKGEGVIRRCGMNGNKTSCVSIVTRQVKAVYDIAIDYDQDIVYWTDPVLELLAGSRLDGEYRQNLIYDEAYSPLSLAVFNGRIYWIDKERHYLFSSSRSGSQVRVVNNDIYTRMDMAVLNAGAQPPGTNYCLNSECKYLCLPEAYDSSDPRNYTCSCPDSYVPVEDDSNDCKPIIDPVQRMNSRQSKITTSPSNVPLSQSTLTTLTTSTKQTTTSVTTGAVTGQYSGNSQGMSSGTKIVLIIGIIALLGFIVTITWCVIKLRKKHSARRSMNFNNPIYRKVTGSVASTNSSIIGLTDPSPGTSSGDVSNYLEDEEEGTAGLINNEEVPEGSNPSIS
uniref:low-density lipoprotein receptor-like isoform X1 n=1 Tax=Styela clava TaxID=7725 RepID=UPI00193A41AB|nr:low-density lipoprotein receptor-like isoform X1 [Styela clava]XP_039260239.1 low-density lipoprotein receptor-like isoform X1 [Styela clava]